MSNFKFVNLTNNHYTFQGNPIYPSTMIAGTTHKLRERNPEGLSVPSYPFKESVKHIGIGEFRLYKHGEDVTNEMDDYMYVQSKKENIFFIVEVTVLESLRNSTLRHRVLSSDPDTQVIDTIHSFLRV